MSIGRCSEGVKCDKYDNAVALSFLSGDFLISSGTVESTPG